MNNIRKKAQLTAFLIIGIVIVASAAILMSTKVSREEAELEEVLPTVERVPLHLVPLKASVEKCMSELAYEALEKIGKGGGYLNPASMLTFNNFAPTEESNALEYYSGTREVIPYWYYLKAPNNAQSFGGNSFGTEAPPLCRAVPYRRDCPKSGDNSIEEQIDEYVEQNLMDCLDGFNAFKEQGFEIEPLSAPKATSYIREAINKFPEPEHGSIAMLVEYPLKVTKTGTEDRISQFFFEGPTDIYELYEMAVDIANHEAETCMFEDQIIEIISIYSGLGDDDLPPFTQTQVGFGPMNIWYISDVKEKLKDRTAYAISNIRILNLTSFAPPYALCANYTEPECAMRQSVLDRTIRNPLRRAHRATVVMFYRPFWEPYLEIKPGQGGFLQATNNIDCTNNDADLACAIVSQLSFKEYNFFYHYSFPVVVQLRKESETRETQLFQFALEGNIRSNRCLKPGTEIITTNVGSDMLCDREFWSDEEMTINVYDKTNNSKKINDAVVKFWIGSLCTLGSTDENGVLVTGLPPAFGGSIIVEKSGYNSKFIHHQDMENPLNVELEPIREKNFEIRLIPPELFERLRTASSRPEMRRLRASESIPPNENQTLMVTLTLLPDSYQDKVISTTIIYDKGEIHSEKINLVPGSYEISGMLIQYANVTIPEELDVVCVPNVRGATISQCDKTPNAPRCLGGENPPGMPRRDAVENYQDCCFNRGDSVEAYKKSNCYIEGYYCDGGRLGGCSDDSQQLELPSQSFDSVINGGVAISQEYPFVLDETLLDSKDTLVLYLLKQDLPYRQHHMGEVMKYLDLSEQRPSIFEPEMK